jgi:hypothetical protein
MNRPGPDRTVLCPIKTAFEVQTAEIIFSKNLFRWKNASTK